MTGATKPFNASTYLTDPEARAEFLRDAIETGNADYIGNARETIARAAASQSDLDDSVICLERPEWLLQQLFGKESDPKT